MLENQSGAPHALRALACSVCRRGPSLRQTSPDEVRRGPTLHQGDGKVGPESQRICRSRCTELTAGNSLTHRPAAHE